MKDGFSVNAVMINFTKVPNKILESKKVSFNEKLIFIYLLRRTQNKDNCFPSYKRISEDLGCSRITAIRAIKSLVDKKFIIKEIRNYKSNIYKLNFKS